MEQCGSLLAWEFCALCWLDGAIWVVGRKSVCDILGATALFTETDGRTDGRTDTRRYRLMDGRADGRRDGGTVGQTHGRTDGRIDGRTYAPTGGRTYVPTAGRMDERLEARVAFL